MTKTQTHELTPDLRKATAAYFKPDASPIVPAGMITIIFLLDPDTRDKINRLTLRAAMKEKMIKRVQRLPKVRT